MATKFPPGQDMENISPKDLEEAKTYTKERKAYKDASKIGNDEEPKTKEKKTARQIARDMDSEQNTPFSNKYIETVGPRISNIKNEAGRGIATGLGLAGMSAPLVADLARAAVTGRKPRSDEDLNELTREVAKGNKMAPGGKVTDKVDYEKDLHEYVRTGTDKVNKPIKKVEDLKVLKHMPEAAAKLAAGLVGSPFASAASGVVNAYRDLPSGKKMRENLGSSYKKGGSVSSASSRADGCATKGKTKGRMV